LALVRGQGLNNCIADVSSFVEAMAELSDKESLPELVANYEAEMIPRGRAEVEASVKNFEMIQDWDKMRQTTLLTNGISKTLY
jgi:2-polyprenyl-6-methoxyphenol hydroxylase-like FAD-dependent oxidoreductase